MLQTESRDPRRAKDDVLLQWAEAFLRAQAESFVEVLEAGLQHVSEELGAKGAAVFQMASDGTYAEAVYQWRTTGLASVKGARYGATEIGESLAAFQRGEQLAIRADDSSTAHRGLRAVMKEQGSTGTMAFPIVEGGTAWLLVFEWRDALPTFTAETIAFGERAASLLQASLCRTRDLTSDADAQSKLLERQKVETLGVMAGGIVHDFNNVLQAVLGLSEMLKVQLPRDSSQHELAGLIGSAATRAAELTHRFLVFSRQGVRQTQSIAVAESLEATLLLLRRSIPENRRIRLTTDACVGSVMMAPIDFEQAIVNLCHNASAAMPSGGTIDIDCRAVEGDRSWLEIIVRDDGAGMTPEQLAHACDVFYTTKAAGEGTGLGLPMVKRTIERAGGTLSLESTPGQGTTVRMMLPKGLEAELPRAEEEGPPIVGDETILVVEDDAFVRRVAATQLQKAGFTVIQAGDGARALELYRDNREKIAAVLTDVVMPGLGGVALYQAMASEGDPPPFLFATGYDPGTLSPEFLAGPGRDFLSKPYPARQMLGRIRRLIDARGGTE